MGFFKRANDEPAEVPCPNCAVLVAADARECDVCGWDMRELPQHPAVAAGPGKPAR